MTLSSYDNDDVTVKGDDGSSEGKKIGVINTDSLKVGVTVSALPTGAATETTLASIDAGVPASLGQKTMASSMAVVLASDQSTLATNDVGLPDTLGIKTASGSTSVVLASDATLPLPTGAATAANQSTEISSLSSIDTKTPSLGQAAMASSSPVVIASNQSAVPVSQSGTWTVQPGNTANTTPWLATISQGGNSATVSPANALKVDGSAVTQPISAASLPLPSGAATSANQATEISSLSSIDAKLTSQATAANQTTMLTALQLIDDIPHAQNATLSKGVPVMGQLDDASTTTATEDAVAVARITAQRALHANLRSNSGTELGTTSNKVNTKSYVANSLQSRIQSVTTSAARAQGAASPLANTEFVFLRPINGTIYWSENSGVTSSTGCPLFKNEILCLPYGVAIYLVTSTGSVNCFVQEGF